MPAYLISITTTSQFTQPLLEIILFSKGPLAVIEAKEAHSNCFCKVHKIKDKFSISLNDVDLFTQILTLLSKDRLK